MSSGANLKNVDSMTLQTLSPRRAEVGDSTVDATVCFNGQVALHHDISNFDDFLTGVSFHEDSAGINLREARTGEKGTLVPNKTSNPFYNVDTRNAQHTIHTQQQQSYIKNSLYRRWENNIENTTASDTWHEPCASVTSDEQKALLRLNSSRLHSGLMHANNSSNQQPQKDRPHEREPNSSSLTTISSVAVNSLQGTERISSNNVEDSADQNPRTDMGTNTNQSADWGQSSAMKVESSGLHSNSEGKDRDEASCSAASTASATTMSPPLLPLYTEFVENGSRLNSTAMGTPSTVSTAFSADDVSVYEPEDFLIMERLSLNIEEAMIGQATILHPRSSSITIDTDPTSASHVSTVPSAPFGHGANMSWDDGSSSLGLQPHGANLTAPSFQSVHPMPQRGQWVRQSPNQSPNFGPSPSPRGQDAWTMPSSHNTRVATFRGEGQVDPYSHSYVPQADVWNQQRRFGLPGQHPGGHPLQHESGHLFRQQGLPPRAKAQYTSHAQVASMTPPRARHTRPGQLLHRPPPGGSPLNSGPGPPSGANPPRSSSEILKTLLRKKACLYEPDTSRAVALVTWLVGRELALAYGYFSRQQLQSGVHACVASKIDSGTITRTKVNRCMQIILNSCFHYIIPRPDGSEENGASFIRIFSEGAKDSSALLASLHPPWNDINVDRETVLSASDADEEREKNESKPLSPQASPRFGSLDGRLGDMDGEGKRAVLLCFNENVRSADDVFRCHNEFIRDTANASKLQLTAHEWRAFFGKDDVDIPMMWGGSEVASKAPNGEAKQYDHLGRMNQEEARHFRTSWCAKRYDHDHNLCGFAHVEVNGGWLRRDPSLHHYGPELCKSLITVGDKRPGHKGFVINTCRNGVECQCCHTREEMLYHPIHYKSKVCIAASSQGQGCSLGDICPYFHPSDSTLHQSKKHQESRYQRHRHNFHHSHTGATQGKNVGTMIPEGAPMLYVNPAPISSFEKQLAMPGLQSLFRRHSSVVRAHLYTPIHKCSYSPFGDDSGIGETLPSGKNQL